MNEKQLKEIHTKFIKEFDVMSYANGCGIGIDSINLKQDIGLVLYFETKEDLNKFPYKEESYQNLPIYRKVIGKIIAC